jgi:nitroreductase
MRKLAITSMPIHELLASRWSGRAFDAAKPVDHDQVITLLEAARWAPSCYGDQPWRFLVWNKGTDAEAWQQAFSCLASGNQAWVKDAPLLLLTTADTLFNHNGQPNRWGQHDTGAAAENLCLQAEAMGLMAHQMGGFDADKARALFGVPERYIPMAMVAVGFPADPATFSLEVRERETAPRKRRELGELFFAGAWDKPII